MLSASLNKTFSFLPSTGHVDKLAVLQDLNCKPDVHFVMFISVYSYRVIPFSVFVELQAAKLVASGAAAVLVAVVDVVTALALRVPLTPHKLTYDLFSSWLVSWLL